jgi:hypothetical protein
MLPNPLKYIIGVLARVDNTSDSKLVTTFLHWESNAVTVFFVNPGLLDTVLRGHLGSPALSRQKHLKIIALPIKELQSTTALRSEQSLAEHLHCHGRLC